MSNEIKAYWTETNIHDTTVRLIVFSLSPGKARYVTLLEAQDAGYSVTFKDIKVRRAPEYDIRRYHSCGAAATVNYCHDPETLQLVEK